MTSADSTDLSTNGHINEIAAILARGVLRVRQAGKLAAQPVVRIAAEPGEHALRFLPQPC
jgi:hypothetical protein